MLKGFRDFLMRGNVVDLAVAFILGAAFGAVVKAFADDFIGGIIGAFGGSPDFGRAGVTVNGSKINFVIVGAVIYFVVVVPVRKFDELRGEPAAGKSPAPSDETRLLTEIRDLLAAQR